MKIFFVPVKVSGMVFLFEANQIGCGIPHSCVILISFY